MRTAKITTAVSNKKLVSSGFLVALGIILPQAFHIFGQNAGRIFLPIQIPVLIAGLILGPYCGGGVGLFVPILSSLLMGMPPVPVVYFMIVELFIYGLVTGIMKRKFNLYISLISAMIAGRLCYGLMLVFAVKLLGFQAPFASSPAFIGGIITGIPGMIIQLIVIPILYQAIKKGGFLNED